MKLQDVTKGELILTLHVKADEIWPIQYDNVSTLNIVNYTDGAIFASENNNFEINNNVGKYLTITDGNAYNEYVFYKSGKNTIYIKTEGDGFVCVIKKRW